MALRRIIMGLGIAAACGGLLAQMPATAPAVDAAGTSENSAGQYWMGVAIENLPASFARQLKLQRNQGLMIVQVLPNSPAEKAGLKAEDVLIAIDGKVLSSQEDLAHAANILETRKDGTRVPAEHKLEFLREGDKDSVAITPALRPSDMVVIGGDLGSFTSNGTTVAGTSQIRNYVLANGAVLKVGPGFTINAPTDSGMKTIKAMVTDGKTIVLSQTTDASGNTKITLNVGKDVYPVDPANLDALPVEFRTLAAQLVTPAAPRQLPAATADFSSLELRLKDLEEQNRRLQEQMKHLIDAMPPTIATQPAGK